MTKNFYDQPPTNHENPKPGGEDQEPVTPEGEVDPEEQPEGSVESKEQSEGGGPEKQSVLDSELRELIMRKLEELQSLTPVINERFKKAAAQASGEIGVKVPQEVWDMHIQELKDAKRHLNENQNEIAELTRELARLGKENQGTT